MGFDFLTSSQFVPQKNQFDLSAKLEAVKNNVQSTKERDEFKTSEAKKHVTEKYDQSPTDKSSNDKPSVETSFSELMANLYVQSQSLQAHSTKPIQTQAPAEKVAQPAIPTLSDIDIPEDVYTIVSENPLMPPADETLSKIASLNAEILSLLETARQAGAKTSTDETVPTIPITVPTIPITLSTLPIQEPSADGAKPDSLNSILDMFGFILNQVQTGQTELSAEEQLKLLENIQHMLTAEDSPLLLTTNLTPEKITELQTVVDNILQKIQNEDDKKTLESFVQQLVVLSPPADKTVQHAQEKTENIAINETKSAKVQPEATQPSNIVTPVVPEKHHTQSRYDARYDMPQAPADSEGDIPVDIDFKSALKDAENKTPAAKATNDNNSTSSAQRFLQSVGLELFSSSLTATTSTTQTATGAAVQTNAAYQSSLTNVVTQAHSATYPHPATQTVMATIQKAVKAGEDTTIKFQLDPPELGRVEVKMSIDKDNVTKIVLSAEKPETLHLLQRDAQILDRALQNAGMDTQGNLSFELASNAQHFGQDSNGRGGAHENGGKGTSSVEESDLIETTMDWHIDPRTGTMHYNVLV